MKNIAEIPDNIRHCRSLQALDCSGNPLAKNLPSGIIHLRNLSQLTLNDVSLTQLPDEIGSLINLRLLEVRENLLKVLPESLTQLQRLESLDLGSNEIEQLPNGIGRLISLRELWLDINEINQIPIDIGHLKRLQCLDISDNKLTQLPNEIGDLESLTNLELSTNQLEEIPATIGQLSKLLILKIDSNNLGQLCNEIGQCISLNELILTENTLSELPITIGNLKKLSNLNIDRNQLTLLPVEISGCELLGVLSLRDNRLTRIPNELSKLKHLHVLDLSGNRLPYLPCSLLDCDLKAIWLAENQAQPMLKFQTDVDNNTGEKILTCYLLPQQHCTTASTENLLSTSKSQISHHESTPIVTTQNIASSPLSKTTPTKHIVDISDKEDRHERSGSVKFADQFEDIKESSLQRHNTPHPKDLRTWRNKIAKKLHTDGHLLHHHGHANQHSGSIHSNHTNDEHEHNEGKIIDNKQQSLSSPTSSLQNKILTDGPRVVTTSSHAHESIEYCPPETSSGYHHDSDTDHNPDDSSGDVYHTGDQSLIEKHVEFTDDTAINEGETKDSGSQKLHRRDTPHHLKNKRILNKNGDQLSLDQILNQSPNKTSLTSPTKDSKQFSSRPMTIQHEQITLLIRRTQNLGLGISIAGGVGSTPYKDNDYGIFITKVSEEGPSGQAGLIVGDKLLSVNGVLLNNVEHHEAVLALKNAGDNIEMIVLRELIIPSPTSTIAGQDHQQQHTNTLKEGEKFTTIITRDEKGFGFSIAGGRYNQHENMNGIDEQQSPVDNYDLYISRLTENGAADKQGEILVGDRILAINGYDVSTASHDQAVDIIMNVGKSLELVLYREKYLTQREQQQQSVISESRQRHFDDHTPKTNSLNKDSPVDTHSIDNTVEEVRIAKGSGPMGLSIVGGSDQACHPFGITERGVFVSKVQPSGSASRTNLRIGDRILKVNNRDVSKATHMEAVDALVQETTEVLLLVRHEPQPSGLKEIQILRASGEPLGIRINGGVDGKRVNPDDQEDDGIFVTEVKEGSPADGHLTVGTRILEVNNQSLFGKRLEDAQKAISMPSESINLLICHGFKPKDSQISPVPSSNNNSKLSKTPHSPSPSRQSTTPPLMRHALQKQQQQKHVLPPISGLNHRTTEQHNGLQNMTDLPSKVTNRTLSPKLSPRIDKNLIPIIDDNTNNHYSAHQTTLTSRATVNNTNYSHNNDYTQLPPPIPIKPKRLQYDHNDSSSSRQITNNNNNMNNNNGNNHNSSPPFPSLLNSTSTISPTEISFTSSSFVRPNTAEFRQFIPISDHFPVNNQKQSHNGFEIDESDLSVTESERSFKDKKKFFESGFQDPVPKPKPRQFKYITEHELQQMKQEEEQKIKSMSPTEFLTRTQINTDDDHTQQLQHQIYQPTQHTLAKEENNDVLLRKPRTDRITNRVTSLERDTATAQALLSKFAIDSTMT
ncbi:unnamed protein product [Didymodactylos carnosus]|uniref:PDZ domain-containing protein n=1 Tax=Didymodactylos carnosus TaxID=1234261 RepID=A0A8S2HFL4_9BILA|nr:unnamed protein product [Didymodactylos carnosus]CAF3637375.1 unnamed protein product [Didymodactylos carnosus]